MAVENAPELPSPKKQRRYGNMLVHSILCVLCTLVGAFYPTLLDWSKTAFLRETVLVGGSLETKDHRAYPFSPVSVVLINDAMQLSIAVGAVIGKEGVRALSVDRSVVLQMMPLGAIYALGELLTFRSVQKGSGPVYVVIANMKLVIAAVMSRAFFGRSWSMPWLHWFELVLISVLATAYTVTEAGSLGTQWQWEGAWMALAKSSLVAFSSVFCEHTYKSHKFLVVLTLQAAWGLLTIVSLLGASFSGLAGTGFARELRDDAGMLTLFGGGPQIELCTSHAHLECLHHLPQAAESSEAVCRCISQRGWDRYTLLTIFAFLSNAISSALVFKKLNAVAKYVCRATSAVPMYLFYCIMGRSAWDTRIFAIILLLCLQVSLYTLQRHKAATKAEKVQQEEEQWAQHYSGTRAAEVLSESEGLRQRTTPAAVP